MFYRIAGITINSEFRLAFPSDFECDPAEADVVLTGGGDLPSAGRAFNAGSLKIYRLPEGWLFTLAEENGAGLIVSEDYTRLCLAGSDSALAEAGSQIEWLIRVALECLLARRGCVSLHAAAVEVDGEAWAFTAPSGTGKSTRAGAWVEAFGAQLISGDRPLINVGTMELNGVPWDGKEQCCRNVHYPLKMICEVRRSDRNYAREMSFAQRRRILLQQCFMPMWDTETSAIQIMNITRLARTAQIVRMFGGPLPEDAKALRSILEQGKTEKEEPEMKAKSGFVLRNVVGEYILIPTGDNIGKFNGTIAMNGVAALVWEKLQSPVSRDDLLAAILDKYSIWEEVVAADLDQLLKKLKDYGVIEED